MIAQAEMARCTVGTLDVAVQESALVKNREGRQLLSARRKQGDRGGVDPAAQKQAHVDVRHQPQLDGILQQLYVAFDDLALAA